MCSSHPFLFVKPDISKYSHCLQPPLHKWDEVGRKEGRVGNVCEEKYNSTVFLKQLKNVFHAGSFQFHNT